MTDKIIRVKIEAGDSQQQINQLDSSMVKLGTSTDKTTAEIAGLNTDLTKTAQGVKAAVGATNEAVGNLGRTTGQAAMQVQQLVGQVQGGVSPFVALSQQAADLGFVLGFPLLGAVVGIGAALAGPLVAAFTKAEEKATDFDNALKGIIATQDEYKANAVVVKVAELNAKFEEQQTVIDNLKRQQSQYIELLKQGGSSQGAYASALLQVGMALDSAKEKQDELSKQIEKTGSAGLSNIAATDEQAKASAALTANLELQRVALEQGELEGRLYAAAQQLQLDSVENLDAGITEHIVAIYELEQAQKAQKEAASELLRISREQEQQAKQKARQDEEDARRAEREQQRIQERIANMQLETDTFASQAELMRAVRAEQFTQEEADLAAQTASRLLAASTEFSLLMENKAITDAQKIDAELAFKEQIKAINEQYALSEEELDLRRAQVAEDTTNRIRNANLSAMSSGVSILETFLGRSNAIVKAARVAMGAYQAFSIYASSEAAAAAALAPPPIGLGPIAGAGLAGAISVAGKASAAAVLASAVAGSFSGGGGGSSIASAGGGSSSVAMPTTPQSAPTVGSFEIAGLADLQRQLNDLDGDEVLPVSFTRRLVASLESVQRLEGSA